MLPTFSLLCGQRHPCAGVGLGYISNKLSEPDSKPVSTNFPWPLLQFPLADSCHDILPKLLLVSVYQERQEQDQMGALQHPSWLPLQGPYGSTPR